MQPAVGVKGSKPQAPNGSAIAAWKKFHGDLYDDSIKRFGSAFSSDTFET